MARTATLIAQAVGCAALYQLFGQTGKIIDHIFEIEFLGVQA
jgi:hypothetical protein